MSGYSYIDSKKRVENILNCKTDVKKTGTVPDDKNGLTYENGARAWVGALFVDIRNSTDYFKHNEPEKVARIMRAFTGEVVGILECNKTYAKIGIRGDCVYAVYSAPKKGDLESIMTDACQINTFQKMFQIILLRRNLPTFDIGIGLGASENLVIKAGKKGTGIYDNIWIGDAVIDASKLSGEGSVGEIEPIVMDECFYINIKDFRANESARYCDYINRFYSSKLCEDAYHCNMIMTEFNDWIDREFNR